MGPRSGNWHLRTSKAGRVGDWRVTTNLDASGALPPPGTAVRSPSGRIGAAVHNGFPGVLLGVWDAGTYRLGIERLTIGGPSEWVRVRTADPVWLSAGGQGAAYDLEVEPGQTYIYRPTYGGKPNPAHEVMVKLPDWGGCGAWLKHLRRPHLSRSVRVMSPWEPDEDTWLSATAAYGSGYSASDGVGTMGLSGTLTLRTTTEGDWRAVAEMLSTPGVMLLQMSPDHGQDPLYIARQSIGHRRPGGLSGYGLREFSFRVVQVARPADLDSPPVVPAWTWAVATAGLDVAVVDSLYPDQWSILLEGVQRWEPDSVGTA
jgi:hypothetical protein